MQTLLSSLFTFLLLAAPIPGGWLGVYLAADRDAAVVVEVLPDSPAQRAGLLAGDEIQAIGDTATPTRAALVEAIGKTAPGTKVVLKVLRNGKTEKVRVEIAGRPDEQAVAESMPARPNTKGKPAAPTAPAAETNQGTGIYLGISIREGDGMVVIERVLPDSPAAAAGVKDGDVLDAIGDRRIRNTTDLDRALAGRKPGKPVELRVRTGSELRSVLVEPRALEAAQLRTPAPRGEARAAEAPRAESKPPAPSARLRAPQVEPKPAETRAAETRPAQAAPDLDAEIRALREELQQLRSELSELKKQLRRE